MKMNELYGIPSSTSATTSAIIARTAAAVADAAVLLTLALYFNLVQETCGVKLTNMTAPRVADPRDDMILDCHFDMGKDVLYAVKWYKDDQEFFRFMPHQQPHMVSFPVAGVHMVPQSNSCGQGRCKVRLTGLSRDHSGGSYRCEISTEAPTFRLASETRNVTVAVLPDENPKILNLSRSYNYGDLLQATCVSPPADPTPILTWYINNEEAPSNTVAESINANDDNRHVHGLAVRSITLRLQVDRKNARGNVLRLKCVSRMPGIPAEPQAIARTVPVRGHGPGATDVNNEKLHWPNASATSASFPLRCSPRIGAMLVFGSLFALGGRLMVTTKADC